MHQPVLLKEVLNLLNIQDGKTYLDGTIGLGGHTEAVLKAAPHVKVIGIDCDETALQEIKKRLRKEIGNRLFLIHANFRDFEKLKEMLPVKRFDGAILDLGLSSFQLDDATRGFSFQKEGPLDMRMDLSQKRKASDLINMLPEKELSEMFYKYGEERHSRQIARAVAERRKKRPFKTTLDLANLILSLLPRRAFHKIHPATRIFQALRIAVNDELEGLQGAVEKILKALNMGGRLAVISFHSLEDRIIKKSFYRFEHPCICPADFPRCVCHQKQLGRRITKKPIVPSEREILMNPRSRSARLRVIERVAA